MVRGLEWSTNKLTIFDGEFNFIDCLLTILLIVHKMFYLGGIRFEFNFTI
jgi:hypothetical protein